MPDLRPILAAFLLAILSIVAAAPALAQAEGGGGDGGGAETRSLTSPEIGLQELTLRIIPLPAGELAPLAQEWQGIIRDQTEEIVGLQVALREAGEDAAQGDRQALDRLYETRSRAFDNFTAVIDALEAKGGDPEVVKSLRAYRNAILLQETQAADWQTLLQMAVNWISDPDGGLRWLLIAAVVMVALFVLWSVARMVRRGVGRAVDNVPSLSELMQGFIAMTAFWLTIVVGLLVVLSVMGVNITPLFALIGGASFIIAFALQDTLGNLASGLMIMINRPFDEGDYVRVAGTAGTVRAVSVSSTELVTPDNQIVTIPNSKVWGDVITNVTASPTRRLELVFGVGYGDRLDRAQEVIEGVVDRNQMVLSDPAPVVRVNELGESSVNFIVWVWARTADYFTVHWDLTRQVKEALDEAGLTIPYPQRDLHLILPEGGLPLRQTDGGRQVEDRGNSDAGRGRPEGAPDYHSGAETEDAEAEGRA